MTTWSEHRKHQQYFCLDTYSMFTPVAIETMGVYGVETLPILKDVGQCLKQVSGGQEKPVCFPRDSLLQCSSLETVHQSWDLLSGFYRYCVLRYTAL